MKPKNYKITIEPVAGHGYYRVHLYTIYRTRQGQDSWEEVGTYKLALTYWGARLSAWWIKYKLERTKYYYEGEETIYESRG